MKFAKTKYTVDPAYWGHRNPFHLVSVSLEAKARCNDRFTIDEETITDIEPIGDALCKTCRNKLPYIRLQEKAQQRGGPLKSAQRRE